MASPSKLRKMLYMENFIYACVIIYNIIIKDKSDKYLHDFGGARLLNNINITGRSLHCQVEHAPRAAKINLLLVICITKMSQLFIKFFS